MCQLINYPNQFYIFGKTTSGKKFRPSDWTERLCGVLSSYRPKTEDLKNTNSLCLTYSSFAYPQNYKGEKVVCISREIENVEPLAWKFITSFIDDNKLIFEEKYIKKDNSCPEDVNHEKKTQKTLTERKFTDCK